MEKTLQRFLEFGHTYNKGRYPDGPFLAKTRDSLAIKSTALLMLLYIMHTKNAYMPSSYPTRLRLYK